MILSHITWTPVSAQSGLTLDCSVSLFFVFVTLSNVSPILIFLITDTIKYFLFSLISQSSAMFVSSHSWTKNHCWQLCLVKISSVTMFVVGAALVSPGVTLVSITNADLFRLLLTVLHALRLHCSQDHLDYPYWQLSLNTSVYFTLSLAIVFWITSPDNHLIFVCNSWFSE